MAPSVLSSLPSWGRDSVWFLSAPGRNHTAGISVAVPKRMKMGLRRPGPQHPVLTLHGQGNDDDLTSGSFQLFLCILHPVATTRKYPDLRPSCRPSHDNQNKQNTTSPHPHLQPVSIPCDFHADMMGGKRAWAGCWGSGAPGRASPTHRCSIHHPNGDTGREGTSSSRETAQMLHKPVITPILLRHMCQLGSV